MHTLHIICIRGSGVQGAPRIVSAMLWYTLNEAIRRTVRKGSSRSFMERPRRRGPSVMFGKRAGVGRVGVAAVAQLNGGRSKAVFAGSRSRGDLVTGRQRFTQLSAPRSNASRVADLA